MLVLTRAQRRALKAVYDRCPLYYGDKGPWALSSVKYAPEQQPVTYKQFRKTVIQFDFDAVGINWCGMWLGIEKDGYTHS